MYINGHGCVPAKKYLHKREWAGFGQLSGVNQLLTESIELKRVMGERLSKALGTSQRKTSFTKWLMEIWKAVYTGGWGDGGEVTEGLIRHRPPCQALPTLRSFSESDLNVSISRPSSTCRGSSQASCFPSWSFCSAKPARLFLAQPSPIPAFSPPTPRLLSRSQFRLFLLLQFPCYLFPEGAHPLIHLRKEVLGAPLSCSSLCRLGPPPAPGGELAILS